MTPARRGRRRRGDGRDPGGLFTWGPGGQVQAGELRANPRDVECRNQRCRARVSEPCVRHKRHRVVPLLRGYHDIRIRDAAQAQLGAPPAVPDPRSTT
ncbi:hypothetical protein NLX83_39645 [Allokutzneria sp. A3M-2-11 16]|uniref:zinc finger domain-containing protein n=1 Tax=Allokutzneria sp. A3M-2-11 16 TaxID=2962043 RepID=UPI0020B817E9|nr:hypothetical protein [Allokutzneria sp. A3M-2-11 16]MCP3805399.1 hypothetical protein [Allokutzneria sp. A3M-2-11 16]